MKYYIIYEHVDPEYKAARLLFIVEHIEVANDFCDKHPWCYYEEVIISKGLINE